MVVVKTVLAIETSCDDTSVAVVNKDGKALVVMSATRDLDHEPYGGIVPEIASRNHSKYLLPLIEKAVNSEGLGWGKIDGIAVTNRPGLMGSLIVGVVTAKTLAQAYKKPLIGINHLEGHLLAPFIKDPEVEPSVNLEFPLIGLVISGGHTSLYKIRNLGEYQLLGGTRDDAAGEAFDKFAKMIGLGFPGGVRLDHEAVQGNRAAYDFPRSMINDDTYDMSFSGLKSAGHRQVGLMKPDEIRERRADLSASYTEAIVDVLISKLERARVQTGIKRFVITGGVSANSRLRQRAREWSDKLKVELIIPPLKYCTDNAAMIGLAGILRLNRGEVSGMELGPSPQSVVGDFL